MKRIQLETFALLPSMYPANLPSLKIWRYNEKIPAWLPFQTSKWYLFVQLKFLLLVLGFTFLILFCWLEKVSMFLTTYLFQT